MATTTRESATPGVYGTDEEKTARRARYQAALARIPDGALHHVRADTGRVEYRLTVEPSLLAELTADDLVDIADRGLGHFGGVVARDTAAGTADITVWID